MYCIVPGESHRQKAPGYSNSKVLEELSRAFSTYPPWGRKTGGSAEHVNIDWSHFRAVMVREVRRRGLQSAVHPETRKLISRAGITL